MATKKLLKKIVKNWVAYHLPTDDDYVALKWNQTVNWVKTFTTSPVVPSKSTNAWDNPTAIATEKQVKNVADSVSTLDWQVVKTTWNQSIWGTKTFTSDIVLPSKTALPQSPSATSPATEKQVENVKNSIPIVDSAMSDSSTNAIQNKIVKAYIDDAIWGITWIDFQIVETLPQTWEKGVFYLILKAQTETWNIYDEYIWISSSSSYELIWTTAIDLSNYVDKTSNQTIWGVKTFTTSPVVPSKDTNASASNKTVVATEAQVAKKLDSDDLGNATISVKYWKQSQASVGSFTTNQATNWDIIMPWNEFYTQSDFDNLPASKSTDNNSYWIYEEVEE